MAAEAMESLAHRYLDRSVSSVFVYVREAHPGENYPHHRSMEDKRRHAQAFRSELNVKRQILLDDLQGTVHKAYGMVPNMTWIIGRGGLVCYKAGWTVPEDVEDALRQTLESSQKRQERQLMPFYTERLAWRSRDEESFKTGLERNGPQAVRDFYTKDVEEFVKAQRITLDE